MRRNKTIAIFIMSFLLIITVFSFAFEQKNGTTSFYGELLYHASSLSEAELIARSDQISLIDYSTYGIATYAITEDTTYQQLQTQGFVQNSISQSADMTSLWTRDPYSRDQYALTMMNVEQAWAFTTGSSNVTVAIIDSGIDTSHPEFSGRISSLSYNSRTEQVGLSYIEDDTGHGTSVAGVIGAIKDNSIGIAGLVQYAKLLVIKANSVDDPKTSDNEAETFMESSIINGIYYAVDNGANVINMSLGGTYANPLTLTAIQYARDHGVIVVAAAGNDGNNDLIYPASFEGVISVAAVNENKDNSTYSNYGPEIDLSAPGDFIYSTDLNNGYSIVSGTSFASPQVAGIAALLISYYPSESSDDIINRLILGAVDDGTVGWDEHYGYGIANAYNAMTVNVQQFTVNFDTDGGTIIDSLTVFSGTTINVADPTKTGFTFEGWFTDSSLTTAFHMGVDPVTSNLTLYAKFAPIILTVHFVTTGTTVSDLQVDYGTTIEVPATTKVGYSFDGWYIDSAYSTRFDGSPVTANLTLYAHFVPLTFQVHYYVNDILYQTESVTYGNLFDLIVPEDNGYLFVGWYTDNALTILYEMTPITGNLDLYAKFDQSSVKVTFYESDLTTVELETYVALGSSVIAPSNPIKPSSPSFDFVFAGWSESLDNITQSLSIYPVYDKIYKPESITLLPGIDTVLVGQSWVDGGTSLIDPLLSENTRSNLNLELAGAYTVYYDIYDQDQVIDTRVRIVHVIDLSPEVVITVNPDVTTILAGDTYDDQGATSNLGDVVTSGTVDTQTEGVYLITYTVTIGDQITTAYKYVYVLNNEPTPTTDTYYIDERSGWTL